MIVIAKPLVSIGISVICNDFDSKNLWFSLIFLLFVMILVAKPLVFIVMFDVCNDFDYKTIGFHCYFCYL